MDSNFKSQALYFFRPTHLDSSSCNLIGKDCITYTKYSLTEQISCKSLENHSYLELGTPLISDIIVVSIIYNSLLNIMPM